ncbi:hypothetical protein DYI95_010730 [Thermaerobacter sp. PB12/4term]|uniref:hypothetical protein n=1 Tax=Thermaerobacter sp. PB12/4term TaxID=2293838 RepID=UPI000E32827C|nr:hypothetical protein [Thermaerobacter sp. PB12/4term]QIA27919.1 hypothetical protein DYI95_010730 [Thermaerobacter sp. PB12/4term]
MERAERKITAGNNLRAVWVSFFNVILMRGPFLGLVGILVRARAHRLAEGGLQAALAGPEHRGSRF